MKKFIFALATLFFLTACFPPNFEPTDPTPQPPTPVEEVDVISGEWAGTFSFSRIEDENEESLVILAEATLEDNSGVVNGELLFLTSVGDSCSLSGESEGLIVSLVAICDGITGIYIAGEVSEGVFAGEYDITSTGFILEDGDFYLTYQGETP